MEGWMGSERWSEGRGLQRQGYVIVKKEGKKERFRLSRGKIERKRGACVPDMWNTRMGWYARCRNYLRS